MKCVAGVATENFCRFGKNIYKSHTQKMHAHTQVQSKMRALFLFSQRNCQTSDIHLPSVPGEREIKSAKSIRGSAKKNANKIINLLKCSRSSSSSACSGSSKAKIHFHVRAMEFTCKFKKQSTVHSHTHTRRYIHRRADMHMQAVCECVAYLTYSRVGFTTSFLVLLKY